MADDLKFAREFPAATRDDWKKLVDGVLKGAPFDKLVGKTYDALRIEPLYERAKDARLVAGRAAAAPWQVVQRVDHPDARVANKQALEDLEGGTTGLALVFAGAAGARGFGLPPTAKALEAALSGVLLEAGIGIEFQIGPQSKDMPDHFAALVKVRGLKPSQLDIRFGFDPLGAMALAGGTAMAWRDIAPILTELSKGLAAQGFKGPFAVADGRIIHDAGGSEAQELAYVLSAMVAYLRALEAGGVALDTAHTMIGARLVADADQFMTMAKFRSLRKLWARVEEACGLSPAPLHIAAETAWRMMTQRDPYVNMLRTTVAVASAGFGGANSITVLPHTLALGLPDEFARRMARNIQLLLTEESNLAKVADPAAGSGGIEDLTQKLCSAAWALFQDIEKAGGIFAALERNLLQQKIATVRAEREKNVARRKDALTGATDFPDIHEAAVEVLVATPVALPAPPPATITFDALTPARLAAPFEKLRDKSDAHLKKTGARPHVFIATLGKASDFTARATFAKNFFEAGGIETVGNGDHAALDDLVDDFLASGAKLACLTSSDEVYAREAEAAAQALSRAGAVHIYLAGRPGDREAAFKAAGIGSFVYVGCDVLATLTAAHDMLLKVE